MRLFQKKKRKLNALPFLFDLKTVLHMNIINCFDCNIFTCIDF